MQKKDQIELELKILEKLRGKFYLLQDKNIKRKLVSSALEELLICPEYKKIIEEDPDFSTDTFIDSVLSYGLIEEFLCDPTVEYISIDFLSPILIQTSRKGLVKTDKSFSSPEELDLFIKKMVVFSGRKQLGKINNLELVDLKGRANIVFSPFGPQITITRAKEKPLSIIDLIENQTLNSQLAAQLWLYMEGLGIKPANILIAGGPGSGKTTLLNAILGFVSSSERIVVIEDTLELDTNLLGNFSRLACDEEVSLELLVKNSLRMRPDRIVVGEVRGSEAKDLITAMLVGKYGIGTLHASSGREIITRLTSEPMNVPEHLVGLVDVFIIMRIYRQKDRLRRVVAEIAESSGIERGKILLSGMWNYNFTETKFEELSVSGGFRERLAQACGKTPRDILDELRLRATYLEALRAKNVRDFLAVAEKCRYYCQDSAAAFRELGL